MKPEQIIDGNKLIAEFMGGKIKIFSVTNIPHYTNLPFGRTITFENLKYNTSWDWLMPVIQRIHEILVPCKEADEYLIAIIHPLTKGKIDATWLAVVDFIKWYNRTA